MTNKGERTREKDESEEEGERKEKRSSVVHVY